MTPPWKYRCSACDDLVDVDDVTRHIDAHKEAADWTGVLSMKRVDDPPPKGSKS